MVDVVSTNPPQTGVSTGDVRGPQSAVDSNSASFDGTTGKRIKDGGVAPGTIVGITGTMAQFDTAVTDGNFVYQGQALGTPLSGVATNLTGTAAGLTAGDVGNAAVIAKVLTGYSSGAGTVAATDTILQAFNKLNGNDGLKANLASPTFTGTVTAPNLSISTAGILRFLQTGTGRDMQLSSVNSGLDGIASLNAYPASGTNVYYSVNFIPRGTGFSATLKGQFAFFNTDYVADSTNYENLAVLAGGTNGFGIQTGKGGSGTVRPIYFDATGAGTPATSNLYLATTGNSGFGGNTSPTAKIHPAAGSATANTMPAQYNTGTRETTARIGGYEYDSNHYVTNWKLLRYPLGGPIFDYFADVSVGGAEADIFSSTLLANTFAINGDKVIASYGGNFVTVGTELTQLKAVFAGTTIWDSTGIAVATGTSSWRVLVELIRVSSTVVRYCVSLQTTGASGFVYCTDGELTGLTLTGTNILKITGTSSGVGSGAGDIVGKQGCVEYKPAVN